jgi:hypothetical protein
MDPSDDYYAINQIMKERHEDRLRLVDWIEKTVGKGYTVDVSDCGEDKHAKDKIVCLLEQRRQEREQASKGQ